MAKFAVQGSTAEEIYKQLGKNSTQMTKGENTAISASSGVVAGGAPLSSCHH
jgi:hypothetical protein